MGPCNIRRRFPSRWQRASFPISETLEPVIPADVNVSEPPLESFAQHLTIMRAVALSYRAVQWPYNVWSWIADHELGHRYAYS